MTAWLLTWEHTPRPQPPARDRIAAILNPRWSAERVQCIVGVLHNAKCYTLSEQAGYANNYTFNPYPADTVELRVLGGDRFEIGVPSRRATPIP